MSDIDRVRTAWDELADSYDRYCGTGDDIYRTAVMGPGLIRACGDVSGLDVLDVGCGTGYFTRLLAERGAVAVGVDVSDRQIVHARRHEEERPLGVTYHVADAARIADLFDPSRFDLVTSCIALQDMPDPLAVLAGARRLLRPGGRVVALVEHPTNVTAYREWERDAAGGKVALRIDRYFDTGPRTTSWVREGRTESFPSWSRTLEEWSAVIAEAGFLIARLYEPRPTPAEVEQVADLDDCSRVPYFLVFDLVGDGPAEPYPTGVR